MLVYGDRGYIFGVKDVNGAKEGRQQVSTQLSDIELVEAKQMVIDWKPGQCPGSDVTSE